MFKKPPVVIKMAEVLGETLNSREEARTFRLNYLSKTDNLIHDTHIDFDGVNILSPSFANEAFVYFTKREKYPVEKRKLSFFNLTRVQQAIIAHEFEEGYLGKS